MPLSLTYEGVLEFLSATIAVIHWAPHDLAHAVLMHLILLLTLGSKLRSDVLRWYLHE